jgi:hypothetical protein
MLHVLILHKLQALTTDIHTFTDHLVLEFAGHAYRTEETHHQEKEELQVC